MRGDLQDGRYDGPRSAGSPGVEISTPQPMELLAPVVRAEAHREGLVDPVQREPTTATRIPAFEKGARLSGGGSPEHGGGCVHASPPEERIGPGGIRAEPRPGQDIGT
jgi:hypothetical protein